MHLDFPYPDAERDLNRWLPLVKWFLAIPHYIVLVVLWMLGFFCVVIAWFAILFTGRYPRGLFGIVESVHALGQPRRRLRVPAGHRPLPAVQLRAEPDVRAAQRPLEPNPPSPVRSAASSPDLDRLGVGERRHDELGDAVARARSRRRGSRSVFSSRTRTSPR